MPKRTLLQRIGRGLYWALLGRPARKSIGTFTKPRELYVEATVTSADRHRDAAGERAAWVRLDMVEHVYGPLGRLGYELSQMQRGAADREVDYRIVRTIVRGDALTLETAHGEELTLREGSFTCTPRELRARELRALPAELEGTWPGAEPDRPLLRESRIVKGDVVRFEAVFTPERHPRSGASYRDEVEIRYRIDGGARPIEIEVIPPEDR